MDVRAVLFDLIGTTVKETDRSTIERCMQLAFADHNIKLPSHLIRGHRGKSKREVISTLLLSLKAPLHLTSDVLARFKVHFESQLHNFDTNDGLVELLEFLQANKIKAGIGTGLTSDLLHRIFHHLKWDKSSFDYVGTASEAGRGRPSPDMINHFLSTHGLTPSQLLKVGDTIADIQEGKNAGVLTAVLLSGTQDEVTLIRQHPDFILHSLTDLIEILKK
jgi:HAD superfamily hydrolase (TIGR01549 family)